MLEGFRVQSFEVRTGNKRLKGQGLKLKAGYPYLIFAAASSILVAMRTEVSKYTAGSPTAAAVTEGDDDDEFLVLICSQVEM